MDHSHTTSQPSRPTGATAAVLDSDILLELAREPFGKQFPNSDPSLLREGPVPQMIFAVDRGNGCVVNNEGVGSIADEDDNVKAFFSYGTSWVEVILYLHLLNEAVTTTRIDLADGIRQGGARLDSNHWQWFNRFDKDNSNP
jgi:hypothetical protein